MTAGRTQPGWRRQPRSGTGAPAGGGADAAEWALPLGHRLLTTVAGVPGVGIIHLDRHLERLAQSARALGVPVDVPSWRAAAVDAWAAEPDRPGTRAGRAEPRGATRAGRTADRHDPTTGVEQLQAAGGALRLRLLVDPGGTPSVERAPLVGPGRRLVRLGIDDDPIDAADPRWRHKVTDRDPYDRRLRRQPGVDDVVLVNQRGEVTETTRASLVVQIGGRWWTPPVRSGCLPGVGRAVLLDRGVVAERVLSVDDLVAAAAIGVVSSLRGWRTAVVVRRSGPVDRRR